jgi:hypothetical protein
MRLENYGGPWGGCPEAADTKKHDANILLKVATVNGQPEYVYIYT